MQFDPKDERELKDAMCWPAGIYDFEVTNAECKVSKNGNAMLALTLKVFNSQGATRTVRDWLVESDAAVCLMKMRHYCATTGDMGAYESGTIENFPGIGAAGKCKLAIENSEQFGSQNKVADYVKPKADEEEKPALQGVPRSQTERANKALQEAGVPDDECPF